MEPWTTEIMGWMIIEWVMVIGVVGVAIVIGIFAGTKLSSGWLGNWIVGKPRDAESDDDDPEAGQTDENAVLLDLDALAGDDRILGALLNAFRQGTLPKAGVMSASQIRDSAGIGDWASLEAVEDVMQPDWMIPATAEIGEAMYGLSSIHDHLDSHFTPAEQDES